MLFSACCAVSVAFYRPAMKKEDEEKKREGVVGSFHFCHFCFVSEFRDENEVSWWGLGGGEGGERERTR